MPIMDSCARSLPPVTARPFLRTVLAYDIAARGVRYHGDSLAVAVEQALNERLEQVGGLGGVIAVDASGHIIVRHNAVAMVHGHVTSEMALEISV